MLKCGCTDEETDGNEFMSKSLISNLKKKNINIEN